MQGRDLERPVRPAVSEEASKSCLRGREPCESVRPDILEAASKRVPCESVRPAVLQAQTYQSAVRPCSLRDLEHTAFLPPPLPPSAQSQLVWQGPQPGRFDALARAAVAPEA